MTSIPANLQNYLARSRTGQQKLQAPESKEDFGKVLDRQKTGTTKENNTDVSKRTETSGSETGKVQEQNKTQEQNKVQEQNKTQEQKDAGNETDMRPETGEGNPEEVNPGEAIDGQPPAETEGVQQPGETEEMQCPAGIILDAPLEETPGEGLEQIMEILQSAVLQIQELLMQQLDLSPQELEQLMREEGVTELQLLQPETVDQLILSAAGTEDPVELVMDENLYQSKQAIGQGFQEITREAEEKLNREGGLSKVLEGLENAAGDKTLQGPAKVPESMWQEDGRSREGSQGHEKGQGQNQGVTGQAFFQNYTSQPQVQTVQQAGTATAMTASYTEMPDSQQVVNQILDYMKLSMKQENTVLNMQLHPESLGTLHIQITAREGIMTAHFTASSEAVKNVLENQMAVLKEHFDQQDIKVDAIEVTVESHQFESNLEQGRQRGGEEPGRRPKRRRLDVSSLESGEELAESEQVITEMMAASGSSVDYLV